MEINADFSTYTNHTDNLVSQESIRTSLGKIQKWKNDFHSVVWDGDADTVGGFTVETNVSSDWVDLLKEIMWGLTPTLFD